jgi:hypothetical protein
MACFSCSKDKDINTITILLRYKEAFEKTGVVYWFFKGIDDNEVNIMNDEDFKKYKAANKKLFTDKKIEFSRIDEFRIATDN